MRELIKTGSRNTRTSQWVTSLPYFRSRATSFNLCYYLPAWYESRGRKRTLWYESTTKTQISLRIHADLSVFVVRMKNLAYLDMQNVPLIWFFVGPTCPKVRFLTLRLKTFCPMMFQCIIPELKNSGPFPLTHSVNTAFTSSLDRNCVHGYRRLSSGTKGKQHYVLNRANR